MNFTIALVLVVGMLAGMSYTYQLGRQHEIEECEVVEVVGVMRDRKLRNGRNMGNEGEG